MAAFGRILRAEWLKLRKSSIWALIFISPAFAAIVGFVSMNEEAGGPRQQWPFLASDMAFAHGLLFMPLLAGIFAAFICRYEHESGGWKQLLALPVDRTRVYLAKLSVVALLLGATQVIYLAAMAAAGSGAGLAGVPLGMLAQCALGGLVASLPIAALQLAVSVGWSSFAGSLAVNVILVFPNILIVNSQDYGPYYPWAQPFLAMMPDTADNFGAMNMPFLTLMLVVGGNFALFLVSGVVYFRRREV